MEEVTTIEIKEEGGEDDELVEVDENDMSENVGAASPGDQSTDWNGLFRCLHCEEVFEEEAVYLEHQQLHDEPIDSVDTAAQSDGLLVSKGDGRRTLCCSLCGRNFLDARGFYSHMKKHRNELSKNSATSEPSSHKQHIYECEHCSKTYSIIGHFLNHQRSHKQASKSVFHELEDLKKKSFQCHTCGRSYSRASALDAHRRCHEVKLIKSRRNRVVEKSFPAEGEVVEGKGKDQPEQMEDVQKPFECSCGKAFHAYAGLKTHQRFSQNEKCSPEKTEEQKLKKEPKREFHCSECEKTYSSRVGLVSHQRWHKNRSRTAGEKFPCEECGKVFTTPTFYYKHQRLAHGGETPAKSFLHQVCQLQKKAFECQDCGLRFSRASALQSHQLCHIDIFKEAEKLSIEEPTSPLPQHEPLFHHTEETEPIHSTQDNIHTPVMETDHETDEDIDDETGDFNVEVISVSESDGSSGDDVKDEDAVQDLNPDLELLCESDQDGKEDIESDFYQTEMSLCTQSKSNIDLKIVEIDFDPSEEDLRDEVHVGDGISPLGYLKKEGHIQPGKIYTCNICGHESKLKKTYFNHIRKHEDRKPYKNVLYQLAGLEKNSFKCEECEKCFSRLSALHSHQQHHPKVKPHQCPDCKTSYSHASGLYTHRKICVTRNSQLETQNSQLDTLDDKGFNPKKTLLGPKIYHCEQCGKGFWSLGAYAHHKQNQTQCADSKGRIASMRTIYGHRHVKVACPVCGKKFRHRGIMKSHMRKHENGNHKCELCGKSYRLLSGLLRHQVVHNAQLLPPPIKSFQHQVEQVKKNTYCCPDCGKRFSRAKALQFHLKSHGYETSYSPSSPKSALELGELQCSTCHAHFSNKYSLKSHQKLCQLDTVNQTYPTDVTPSVSSMNYATKDKTVECPTCSSLFNSLLSLKFHRKRCRNRSSTDESSGVMEKRGPKKLSESDDQLPSRAKNEGETTKLHNLEKSALSNKPDLKYKCKECERSFAVVGALNFHKRIHLQGHTSKAKRKLLMPAVPKKLKQVEQVKGQFFCSECGRRFVTNAALGTHKRWHTDKKFAGSLVRDEMTNSAGHKSLDEGPFRCSKCGKGFFYLCVLRRHQLYSSCQAKGEPEPEADTSVQDRRPTHTKFACPECNKTFVRGSLLAAHYESVHGKLSEPPNSQEDRFQAKANSEVAEEPVVTSKRFETIPLNEPEVGTKGHQCPHCNQIFAKIRGLRAHKWQAHSKRGLKNSKGLLTASKRNEDAEKAGTKVTVAKDTVGMCTQTLPKKKKPKGKRKWGGNGKTPYKSIRCLDCGKRYSSPGALYNHKKICSGLKQETKPVKTVSDEHSPPIRQAESTAKCFFKCDKCGKAFPTEQQLGAHKDLAKSRPYSCALCCRGYWTETQLQHHLTWHDEVRRRLPTELRYRLSATMTSGPAHLNLPLHKKANPTLKPSPTLNPSPRLQNGHKCQHCSKAFLSPAALQSHEAQHNSDDSYRCSLCPRTFSEIRDLIDHHQECMGDDKGQPDVHAAVNPKYGLTCIECGISFSNETELHQHYIEHARGAY